MSKPKRTSPRLVTYRGVPYDLVPGQTVQYRGAVYVLAADTPDDLTSRYTQEMKDLKAKIDSGKYTAKDLMQYIQLVENLQQSGEQQVQQIEEQVAKQPQQQKGPSEGDQQAQREEQLRAGLLAEVEKNFPVLIANVEKDAKDLLSSFNVAADPVALDAAEADGIDILGDIKKGHLTGLTGVATITLDYALKFPDNPPIEVKIPAQMVGKEPGVIEEVAKNIPNLTKAKFDLQEIVVHMCDHNFAAQQRGDIESLLDDAVAFFQNAPTLKIEKGPLLEPSKEGDTEEAQKEWLKKVMQEFVNRKLNEVAGVHIHQRGDWSKIDVFKNTVSGLKEQNFLAAKVADTILKMVDKLGQQGYNELMRDALREQATPPASGPKALQQTVENAVKTLTSHEKYTGKVDVGYSKDDKIVASIVAPYKMQYFFDKAGINVKLIRAEMEFCESRFVVTSVDDARGLLTANLELFSAYNRAVNPSLSQLNEKNDMMAMFRKVHTILEKSDIGGTPPTQEYAPAPAAPAAPAAQTPPA